MQPPSDGNVTVSNILCAIENGCWGELPVLDAGTRSSWPRPTKAGFDTITKMLLNKATRLPVVDRADLQTVVRWVSRARVMACWRNIYKRAVYARPARSVGCGQMASARPQQARSSGTS